MSLLTDATNTRRRTALVVFTVFTALAASGCGSDDAPAATDTSATDPAVGEPGGDTPTEEPSEEPATDETPAGGTPAGFSQLWSHEVNDAVGLPDGFAVTTFEGELVVLEAGDGTERWSVPAAGAGTDDTMGIPAVEDGLAHLSVSPDGDVVYYAASEQTPPAAVPTVTAYDATTGDELWQVDVPDALPMDEPLDASAGLVHAYGAVLSPQDGSVLAENGGLGGGDPYPVSSDIVVIHDGVDSGTIRAESATGELLWDETGLERSPSCEPDEDIFVVGDFGAAVGVFGGVVVTSCFAPNGSDVAVMFSDPATGALIDDAPGDSMETPISAGVHDSASGITVINGGAGRFGIDVDAGEVLWSDEGGPIGTVADGRMYSGGEVLDIATGEVVETGAWEPALAVAGGPYLMYLAEDESLQGTPTGLVYGQ